MTVATLFTPKIPSQFDEASSKTSSTDTGWDSYAEDTDSMGYDDIAGAAISNNTAEQTSSTQILPTETAEFRKLQKKLRRQVSWAIRDFNMIEDGDVVMVCVSGGKDSYTLLDILLLLKRIAPISFDIVAVNLDQKQPVIPKIFCPLI